MVQNKVHGVSKAATKWGAALLYVQKPEMYNMCRMGDGDRGYDSDKNEGP